MKKVLITLITVVCTVGAFGQSVIFNNNVSGQVIAPIFGPENNDPTSAVEVYGQTTFAVTNKGAPNPFPQGTAVYTGNPVSGTGYSAQLWGAKDTGAPGQDGEALDAMRFGGNVVTVGFRTINRFLGAVVAPAGAMPVAGAVGLDYVLLQMRVWDNRGGTITSWDQVINTPGNEGVLRGASRVFRLQLPATGTINMVGLESFNIHAMVPEPSVIAMGVLGLGALVLLRRRKN